MVTWQQALDWTKESGQRRRAIYERSTQLAYTQAHKAHPETNGEPLLVHNWGNDTAKRAWQRHAARTGRIGSILDAAYTAIWNEARKTL